jgi:RNA polymerase sigma-70 factor (ECF subfamily)
MQAEPTQSAFRNDLIGLLPRLKRFADVLLGERGDGTALLGRALKRMLAEDYRYQRGTPLDRWAFAEVYRLWLQELRDQAEPLHHAKTETSFDHLFHVEERPDEATASFLGNLPPQQRSALLLVYGEGFDYEDAARVLDCSAETVARRLVRASSQLADRIDAASAQTETASVETLHLEGPPS